MRKHSKEISQYQWRLVSEKNMLLTAFILNQTINKQNFIIDISKASTFIYELTFMTNPDGDRRGKCVSVMRSALVMKRYYF